MDVWGLYRVPSTMVNDFSRATWTFLLHHKSDTLPIFSDFLKMVHTLVKKIRSRGGGWVVGLFFSKPNLMILFIKVYFL